MKKLSLGGSFNLLATALFLMGGFFVGNVAMAQAVIKAPTLTITGFTADSTPMPGSLAGGYTLKTDGNSNTQYPIQFNEGSGASEDLYGGADDTIGLFLQPTGVQTSALVSYYRNKPEAYRTYLNAAAAGTLPFALILTNGTAIQLFDGAMKTLANKNTDMIILGDFPAGTYTFKGTITGNLSRKSTVVTFKLIVVAPDTSDGNRAIPVVQAGAVVPGATPAYPTISGEVENLTFSLLLKMGTSNKTEVMELQKFLNGAGHDTLVVDGKFGKLTKAALIKFQLANGLVGDGVVGPLTRAVLNK